MKRQLLFLIFGLGGVLHLPAQTSDAQNALSRVEKHFFIENKGQWPDEVLYLTRIGGLDAWITRNGVLYDFYHLTEVPDSTKAETFFHGKFEHKNYSKTGHKVWYQLKGNNSKIYTEGKERQSGYYNYLIGNDPNKHASNVGLYREVMLKNVYQGIDLRYYFEEGKIRYDYVVHPGADPSQIVFALEGTDKTWLNPKGDLVFNTRFGEMALAELQTYQGTKANKVASSFVKTEKGWGIALGNYDNTQTLIIDPLIYSTYLGGSGYEEGTSISIDYLGNAYVTGGTNSTNYDTTTGVYQTTYAGGLHDVFVTKLNTTGTALVYSTFLGGSGDDVGYDIAIDVSGNTYVTGYTKSTNYVTTSGAYKRSCSGNSDVIVTKLNATGTALVYSTYLGGLYGDQGFSIAVSSSGNVYVTGYTLSYDYDITSKAYQTGIGGYGYPDVFVTKLNATGTALVYSTFLGGSADDVGNDIAIDVTGNAYVTGTTTSANYNITTGAYQRTNDGFYDVFVTKLNATGMALVYSTYLGGKDADVGYAIDIDASGNAYVTGYTLSTDYDTTSGAYQTSSGGIRDVFVTKFNATGTSLVYSTYLGGNNDDFGFSLAVDVYGNACFTGYTYSANYDTTSGAYQTSFAGATDVFLSKLNTTGTALVYSTYLGGSSEDRGSSITIDASGNAYVTGGTLSANYDTTSGAYQTSYTGGNFDVVVTRVCFVPKAMVSLSLSSGADSQNLCINTPVIGITYSTTNATYATVTGLPDGVKYNFASNAITISGAPFVSGTYNYNVFVYGGCSISKVNGSIAVKPNNAIKLLSSSAGKDSQIVCLNTAISTIRYLSTGASGATINGLPPGVTGRFVADTVTLNGTPTASGTYHYTFTLTGGCGTTTANGVIIVKPDNTLSLFSAIGTDSQSVCINTAIANIRYLSTGASGATFSGLPPGVKGSFVADTVTLSGTPTASGTYHYTVTLTGGCGTVIAKGSIIVNPYNTIGLSSAPGTDSQRVCINTAINNIRYASTGASGTTFLGLPTGVSGSFAADTINISGTPTASGTYYFIITLTGGCRNVTTNGSITVKPDNTISLSSAKGTDSQSVCINNGITDITYLTTDATGATFSGLPAGVTGSFANNTVSISGTPTASGTFNYTVTLSGGCGTASANGRMIIKPVNTITLSSASGTDAQSVKLNSAITNITYATTGASGATFSGLPAGVTGSFANNTVSISGTPTASGTYHYTVTLTGGCDTIKATGSIHVGSSGIATQIKRQTLQMFPNPTDVEVNIQVSSTALVQIEITDALGRVIRADYTLDMNAVKLRVVSLANGVYSVRVTDNGQVFQGKLIVQH